MDEYIGKEALIASIESIDWYSVHRGELTAWANSENALYKANDIYSAIDNIPTADVVPIRHGRWEWFEEWSYSTPEHSAECDDCGWRCSECKTALEDMVNGYYDDPYEMPQLNYCPNCGVRMDGE